MAGILGAEGLPGTERDTACVASAMPGVRLLTVRDRHGPGGGRAATTATFEMLDNALLYRRQFVEADGPRGLARLLRSMAPVAARRARALARVESEEGVALVDALVEAAITQAGSTVGSTVSALRQGNRDSIAVGGSGRPEVTAWMADGRLVCSFELSPQLRWTSDRLVVRLPLFEVSKDGLKGRTVHKIAEHPMLPRATRIASCTSIDGETEFRLRSATRVVGRRELT